MPLKRIHDDDPRLATQGPDDLTQALGGVMELPNMKICSVEGCVKKALAQGFCGAHYQREKAAGRITLKQIHPKRSDAQPKKLPKPGPIKFEPLQNDGKPAQQFPGYMQAIILQTSKTVSLDLSLVEGLHEVMTEKARRELRTIEMQCLKELSWVMKEAVAKDVMGERA